MTVKPLTKREFCEKPKIRGLNASQQAARWAQHRRSILSGAKSVQHRRQLPGARVPSGNRASRKTLSPGAQAVVAMLTGMDAQPIRVLPQLGAGSPTCLFSVRQIFEPTTATTAGNEGRFAVICTPRIGTPFVIPDDEAGESQNSIETAANYIVRPDSEYPTGNWGMGSNYETGTNTGSRIRDVDDSFILTQNESNRVRVNSGGSVSLNVPLGTDPTFNQQFPEGFQPEIGSDSNGSTIRMPPGRWLFVFSVVGTGLTGISQAITDGMTTEQFGFNNTGTEIIWIRRVTFRSVTDVISLAATGTTLTSSNILITPFPGGDISDNGAISTIKPLAMQVLATSISANLDNGGTITGGLLHQNDLRTKVLSQTPASSPGPPQLWENLGKYRIPGSIYNGPFKDGCYVWWLPQDVENTELKPPSLTAQLDYPSICVSGQFNISGEGSPGGKKPLRVIVNRVFEYTSDSQALNSEMPQVTNAEFVEACQFVSQQPRAMANNAHDKWLRYVHRYIDDGVSIAEHINRSVMPALSALKVSTGGLLF